jgi:hypothetical protein
MLTRSPKNSAGSVVRLLKVEQPALSSGFHSTSSGPSLLSYCGRDAAFVPPRAHVAELAWHGVCRMVAMHEMKADAAGSLSLVAVT